MEDVKFYTSIICGYCKEDVKNHGGKSIDHIIPKYLGGENKRRNYIICCKECNNWKANKTMLDWLISIEFYIDNQIPYRNFIPSRMGQIRKTIKTRFIKHIKYPI